MSRSGIEKFLGSGFRCVRTRRIQIFSEYEASILDDIAKEKFRELLAQQCAFSQIELVTFCLIGMKDYRWSGYGEVVAGISSARAGLTHLVKTECGDDAETATWDQVQAIYHCWLYEEGQAVLDDDRQVIRRGFSAETTEAVINRQQGALARPVLVKMRVRHFTEGMAIGSKAFIETMFQA